MRRALCDFIPKKIGSLVPLEASEAKHLTSVLRLGPGDEVEIIDGTGMMCRGSLFFREKEVFVETKELPTTNLARCSIPLHLSMSIIKGDAMEWVIEKACELGVRSLTPVETEFTVVKTQKRGSEVFQERWQKIADQSLKQSRRLDRMTIHLPKTFEESLHSNRHLIWMDETLALGDSAETSYLSRILPTLQTEREIALLIGPEGGFSSAEKQRLLQLTQSPKNEITRAGLGAIVLRAETAALLGVSLTLGHHRYGK